MKNPNEATVYILILTKLQAFYQSIKQIIKSLYVLVLLEKPLHCRAETIPQQICLLKILKMRIRWPRASFKPFIHTQSRRVSDIMII